MDIELLRAYVAVVDTGSLTRAARQVHRTQAAVSMQMKRLEEQAGCPLFRKDGRTLALTDDGKQLVSYARRLLALHDEALSQLAPRENLPALRVGCPDDYAQSLLPLLVATLRSRHPELTLQLSCAPSITLRQRMDDGELDLTILTQAPGTDEGHLLLHDTGVWLCAPEFDWDGHAPLPLVLYEADCKFHSAALDGLTKQHRAHEVVALSSQASVLLALVRQLGAVTAVATTSKPDDLIEADPAWNLPMLPSIDIALLGTARAHPLVSSAWIAELIQAMLPALTTKKASA